MSNAIKAQEASVYLREQLKGWTYSRPCGITEVLDALDALVIDHIALSAKFDRVVSCR